MTVEEMSVDEKLIALCSMNFWEKGKTNTLKHGSICDGFSKSHDANKLYHWLERYSMFLSRQDFNLDKQ